MLDGTAAACYGIVPPDMLRYTSVEPELYKGKIPKTLIKFCYTRVSIPPVTVVVVLVKSLFCRCRTLISPQRVVDKLASTFPSPTCCANPSLLIQRASLLAPTCGRDIIV